MGGFGVRLSERLQTVADIEEALEAAASQVNSCAVALDRMNLGGRNRDGESPASRLLTAYCAIAETVESLQSLKPQVDIKAAPDTALAAARGERA